MLTRVCLPCSTNSRLICPSTRRPLRLRILRIRPIHLTRQLKAPTMRWPLMPLLVSRIRHLPTPLQPFQPTTVRLTDNPCPSLTTPLRFRPTLRRLLIRMRPSSPRLRLLTCLRQPMELLLLILVMLLTCLTLLLLLTFRRLPARTALHQLRRRRNRLGFEGLKCGRCDFN